MPAVEIDVGNIPDIIEAQLTLSYSRLSDLIRVIVEQGNGHEDDITALRARLDKLERENASLRNEVDNLKGEKGDDGRDAKDAAVQQELEALRQRVKELAEAQAAEAEKQEAAHKEHNSVTSGIKDDVAGNTAAVDALQQAVDALADRVREAEQASSLPKAFTDLWAGRPELIFAMASHDERDPGAFEHTVEERTAFLHSLPAFTQLRDELDVLRTMINKQAVEALNSAAKNSRSNSAAVAASRYGAAEVDQLTEALRQLEQRLAHVESQQGRRSGGEAADAKSAGEGDAALAKDLREVQARLAQLEERLARLFEAKDGAEDGVVDNAALVDLGFRVRALEQTVEGYRGAATAPAPAAGSGANDVNGVLQYYGTGEGAAAAGGEVSRRTGSNSNSQVGLPEASKDVISSSGGGRASSATQRPPISGRSNSLPPLASAPTPLAAAGGVMGSDRATPLSRRISQPTVESLRAQEVTAAARSPLAGAARRISVAVDQDEGLIRRVAQLEENTAILEVNKADRRELHILEEAFRSLALQQQRAMGTASGAGGGAPAPGAVMTPHRPQSAVNYAPGVYGGETYPDATPMQGTQSRPQTGNGSYTGRPLFVGGSSSVNLRDGGRLTSATISATPPLSNR